MHIPVLEKEVLEYLNPKPNENFIDCTIGEGGHTAAILEKTGPDGKVLGIDQDQKQIENCKLKTENFKERLILVNGSYVNLEKITKEYKFGPADGILFDLGMSSWHLEKSGRGFSFTKDEQLDMRYGGDKLTAEKIVNEFSGEELERVLREYGEEKFSRRIAGEIVGKRKTKPIKSTFQLIEAVEKAIPSEYRYAKIHFATRTFQALRIAVNDELNNFRKALPQALEVLGNRGRIVMISFHSLEDRIAKNFLKEETEKGSIKILTKKPIRPGEEEVINNFRSRSAKLRAGIKL